jgi:predicted Zn-dependent protease
MNIHLIYGEDFPQHHLDAAREGIEEMCDLAQTPNLDIRDEKKPPAVMDEFKMAVRKEQFESGGFKNEKVWANLLLCFFMDPENYGQYLSMAAPGPDDKVLYLTQEDLYASGTRWVFGSAFNNDRSTRPINYVSAQSPWRIENGHKLYKKFPQTNEHYRASVFKTVIMHEFGHMLGLLPEYLPNHTQSGKPVYHHHCKHKYCAMSQDTSVMGWLKKTDLRLERSKKDLPPLCPGCLYELTHRGEYKRHPEFYMSSLQEYIIQEKYAKQLVM